MEDWRIERQRKTRHDLGLFLGLVGRRLVTVVCSTNEYTPEEWQRSFDQSGSEVCVDPDEIVLFFDDGSCLSIGSSPTNTSSSYLFWKVDHSSKE